MKTSPETILALSARTATFIGSVDPEQGRVQAAIDDPNHPYWSAIRTVFAEPPQAPTLPTLRSGESDHSIIHLWIGMWPVFCGKFGLAVEVDFEALKSDGRIINRPKGFDWVVYCPKGLTTRAAFELCKKQFSSVEAIPVEGYSLERDPGSTDLILCRATIEPDKKWLRKSADDMATTKTLFLDARERYMLEAFYFWLTKHQTGIGQHLDVRGWTRCPRSRHSDGKVAGAGWDGGSFYAGWGYAGNRGPDAGGREAVSLNPQT